jgi:hypothetical protein
VSSSPPRRAIEPIAAPIGRLGATPVAAEGKRACAANQAAMADSNRGADPRVSRQELRAALVGGGVQGRRLPASPGAGERRAAAAWDWSADERSDAELAELRAALVAQRRRVAELERDASQAQERERQLSAALQQLAAAGRRQRRRLTAELRGRGLL